MPGVNLRTFLHGLDDADAAARLKQFGPNALPQQPARSCLAILAAQLKSFIVLLLLAAVGIAALLGEYSQAVAILAALTINVGFGFAMDYQAETVIASLGKLALPTARVRRGGRELELPAQDLVPGDVVLLTAGDRVPADARVAQGQCHVDESLLTGESEPRLKRPEAPDQAEVFAGTLLTRGSAVAVVTRTGAQTAIGRIGVLLGETRRPRSPIDERLELLGGFLLVTVTALSAIILGLGLWQGREPGPLLQTAIALAVAAIPEGLPSVATLAMAAGVRRLGRFGLRVRHLAALEALGGVTTLCLDKTGTLTLNAMTVERIDLPGRSFTVSGEGWDPDGTFFEGGSKIDPPAEPSLATLLRVGLLCNEATWERDESGWHVHGDPSEGALLVAAGKAGLEDDRARLPQSLVLMPAPERPWMLVVRGDTAYVKGAPEQVLARCTTLTDGKSKRALQPRERETWLARGQELARQGLRVFAVAQRSVEHAAGHVFQNGLAEEGGIVGWWFLGVVALRDRPRADAREMLAAVHRAGIRTIMITGDHPSTAEAIARNLDLAVGRAPRVTTGEDLEAEIDVYARATPEGKLRLVQALQARGEVVAMTGDGVNDAPALRAAVVGVAMGRGTHVARDAASVVLVDESLATLLVGIREGRGAFLNIQKSVDYLLTCSMATMLVVIIASAVALPLPMGPLQILYLNLLMHSFPALGLALEPAGHDVLERPPLPRRAWLLGPARMFLILWHGVIISTATLAVAGWGFHHDTEAHGRTLAFATLAVSLLVHALADRASGPFAGWRWRGFWAVAGFLGAALALLVAALYVPGLSQILDLTGLEAVDWLAVLIAAALAAVAVEISKAVLPDDKAAP